MKKVLLIIAIVLCSLCLFACNNEETDNSNNSTKSDIPSFEMQNVSNLQCEIIFGQTNEEIVFEKEKALELYNIIANCNYTELNGMPAKNSVNPSSDYISVNFTGDKYSEEFPTKQYGCYFIYTDDVVSWNLSKYMSYISYYQYEEGLYSAVTARVFNAV